MEEKKRTREILRVNHQEMPIGREGLKVNATKNVKRMRRSEFPKRSVDAKDILLLFVGWIITKVLDFMWKKTSNLRLKRKRERKLTPQVLGDWLFGLLLRILGVEYDAPKGNVVAFRNSKDKLVYLDIRTMKSLREFEEIINRELNR